MNGNLWVSVTAEAISTFRHLPRRSWSNFLARQAPGPDHSLATQPSEECWRQPPSTYRADGHGGVSLTSCLSEDC
jgi:hypothetical protein